MEKDDIKKFLDRNIKKDNESLFVVNNISVENLEKTLTDFNGLLVPSLAIINNTDVFNKYGAITLVFDPKIIFNGKSKTNQQDKINFTYSSDMYSVRFPVKHYDFNTNYNDLKFYSDMKALSKLTGEDINNLNFNSYNNQEKILLSLKESPTFLLQFLEKEIGESLNYEPSYKKKKPDNYLVNFPILKTYIRRKNFEKNYNEIELIDKLNKAREEKINTFKDTYLKIDEDYCNNCILKTNRIFDRIIQDNKITEYGLNTILSLSQELKNPTYIIDLESNTFKLKKILERSNLIDKFNDRCEKETFKYFKSPHILHNNKKIPYNEENIIRIMKREKNLGAEETIGFSVEKLKSFSAVRLYNLDDILDRSQYIVGVDNYRTMQVKAGNSYNSMIDSLSVLNQLNIFDAIDLFDDYLENQSQKLDKNSFINYIDNKKLKIDDNTLIHFDDLSNFVYSNDTCYFETKLFKKINANEIKAVIAPRNIPKELKEQLKDINLKIYYYDKNNQEERLKALNKCNNEKLNAKYLSKLKNQTKLKY